MNKKPLSSSSISSLLSFTKTPKGFRTLQVLVILLLFISSCKKPDDTTAAQDTGTLTDVDNNVYKTIKIGNQWWMAQDLNTRRFRNGNYLHQVQSDSSQWSNDSLGAYCNVLDNSQNIIGKLYNFYAVTDTSNLAPAGWHIATDNDWRLLEQYLGMSAEDAGKLAWRGTTQGNKLKVASPNGWTAYGDIWSTNESGFTALALGCRIFNGGWADPGLFATGWWWTASPYSSTEALYRYLDYKTTNVFRSHCSRKYGFGVRCVKD